MFTITFENEIYTRWSPQLVFTSLEDAKEYLTEQGFIEQARLFERKDYKWSKYLKAYINPVKVYIKK